MSTLAEVFEDHRFHAGFGGCADPCGWQSSEGPDEETEHANHLAVVMTDWLTNDEAVEVVARLMLKDYDSQYANDFTWHEFADTAQRYLAARAANTKGTSTTNEQTD